MDWSVCTSEYAHILCGRLPSGPTKTIMTFRFRHCFPTQMKPACKQAVPGLLFKNNTRNNAGSISKHRSFFEEEKRQYEIRQHERPHKPQPSLMIWWGNKICGEGRLAGALICTVFNQTRNYVKLQHSSPCFCFSFTSTRFFFLISEKTSNLNCHIK